MSLLLVSGIVLLSVIWREPFFISKNDSVISSTGLNIYYIQPIVLRVYEKSDAVFLRIFYFSPSMRPVISDVWVAGSIDGYDIGSLPYKDGNRKAITLTATEQISANIKLGRRYEMAFITGRTIDGRNIMHSTEICHDFKRVCDVFKYVAKNSSAYDKFSVSGKLAANIILPILHISSDLRE